MLILTFTLLFFSQITDAQAVKMNIFTNAPEWNNRQFCDNGSGVKLSPINAPSISYSSKDVNMIKDAVYTYSWEQKQNDGNWVVVSSGKQQQSVPGFKPPVLYYEGNSKLPVTKFWRLTVKDEANGGDFLTSDIFSVTLGIKPEVAITVSPNPSSQKKIDFHTTTTGGFPGKQYTWRPNTGGGSVPTTQMHVEHPVGLDPGVYIVEIDDKICLSIKQKINTNASSSSPGR